LELKVLNDRDREEEMELKKYIDNENAPTLTATPVRSEIIGRQTGTAEWKAARGEDGHSTSD
jgi:hypothetical protein